MSHAGKKVLSHGRGLIRPSERGLDRLDRQKGYVAQAERRHNPDKTKNNVNIRKNDRKEANLVMSLYCQFHGSIRFSVYEVMDGSRDPVDGEKKYGTNSI